MPKHKTISTEEVRIQKFTKKTCNGTDTTMVKHCYIDDNNLLAKDASECWLSSGEVETITTTVKTFAREYTTCARNQALCLSNVDIDGVQNVFSGKNAQDGDLTRTRDNFFWAEGPAAILIDFDGFDGTQEQAIEMVSNFWSGFEYAAKVIAPSTSAGIFNTDTDQRLTTTNNFHTIVFVEDASTLPEPKILQERANQKAWLAGYGNILISRSGCMLIRCVVDTAVFSPERLVFRGVPDLDPPLNRKVPDAKYIDGDWVDTAIFTEPLSQAQVVEYNRLVTKAKIEKCEEARLIREQYMGGEIEILVKSGNSPTEARRIIEARLDGNLIGNDQLYFDEINAPVTIADVLSDPTTYHNMTLADPVEPDYGGTPGVPTHNKAILYHDPSTNQVTIYSHAHGGLTYFLKYDRDTVLSALQALKNTEPPNTVIIDAWKRISLQFEGDKLDRDQIYQWFKSEKIASIGALRELDKTQNKSEVDDPGIFVADKVLNEFYAGGENLKHTNDGSFWGYNEMHWERATDDSVRNKILPAAKYLSKESGGKFQTANTLNSAFTILSAQQACNSGMMALDDVDPSPIINLKNGELHLTKNGPELKPHSHESNTLYVGNIEYDALAKCPAYDEFMELVFRGEDCVDVIRHVEEIFGYIIQQTRWLKLNVLMYGDGYNAKTPIAEIPQHILGHDIVTEIDVSKLDSDRWMSSTLVGKLIALDDDLKFGASWPDSQMKKLSEQKLLKAEFKSKDLFHFVNRAVPVVLCNAIPYFRDTTPAIRERLQVIYFKHSFKDPKKCKKSDPYSRGNATLLLNKIFTDELPGVLNHLIDGYYRLKERGHLSPPLSCEIAKDSALKEGNTLLWFLSNNYEHDRKAKSIKLSDLHDAYVNWSTDSNVHRKGVLMERAFSARLRDAGYEVKESHGQTKVFGIVRKETEVERKDAKCG